MKHLIENERVVSIECPDSLDCYITLQHVGNSYIYKSTDQGNTWDEIYKSDPFNEGMPILINVEDASCPLPSICYMAMLEEAYLKKTTDDGRTFERINLDYDRAIREIVMKDTNLGVAAVDGLYFLMTFDGWKTNKKIATDTLIDNIGASVIWSPVFLNSDTLVFISSIYNCTDDSFLGQGVWTWNFKNDEWSYYLLPETFHNPFTGEPKPIYDYLAALHFVNDTLGFICGTRDTSFGNGGRDIIYRTKDGGKSWKKILQEYYSPHFGLQKISFKDEINGVAVGQFGKVLVTSDGGDSWEYLEIPEEMSSRIPPTMEVEWAGEYAIIGTYSAGFYRIEETIGIRDILHGSEINIRQSPDKLFIAINDPHFRKYKLQIFDIMGNVALEQELSSGVGTLYVPYDLLYLTTGAYLYMISYQSVVVKTGKLVLIRVSSKSLK